MKSLTPAAIAAVLILGALHGSAGAATLGTSALVSPAIIATGEHVAPVSPSEESSDPVLQVLEFILIPDADIDSADVSSADTSTDSGE